MWAVVISVHIATGWLLWEHTLSSNWKGLSPTLHSSVYLYLYYNILSLKGSSSPQYLEKDRILHVYPPKVIYFNLQFTAEVSEKLHQIVQNQVKSNSEHLKVWTFDSFLWAPVPGFDCADPEKNTYLYQVRTSLAASCDWCFFSFHPALQETWSVLQFYNHVLFHGRNGNFSKIYSARLYHIKNKIRKANKQKTENQTVTALEHIMLFSSTVCQSTDKITAVKKQGLKSFLYEKKYPLSGIVFPITKGVL